MGICPYIFKQDKKSGYDRAGEQNPGCDTKDFNNYTAIDIGKVYHHPLIVHYAKLGSSVMQLNFREYTSVLSVHKFIRPERTRRSVEHRTRALMVLG